MDILGTPKKSAAQAAVWAESKKATYEFLSLAAMYWEVCGKSGVNPEVAYSQAAWETKWGKYGGIVQPSWHNYCGLKNTNSTGNAPSDFKIFATELAGVTAHCDHLALYAGAAGYPKSSTPDPRHFPRLLGTAKTVEELGVKWATASGYSTQLLRLINELREGDGMALKVVSRAQWGAHPPKSTPVKISSAPEGIFVHYTGSDSDEQSDHAKCAGRVKGIQEFHQGPSRGWNDIAYSFLVCKHGVVYEGRGWGVQGAHTLNYNSVAHAVCFLGNDSVGRDDVTDEGRAALAAVINESFAKGYAKKVRGHRDVNSTSCPGDELWNWVHSNGWLVEPVMKGFWQWFHWYQGSGKFKDLGPRAEGHRPDVPAKIPEAWWAKRKKILEG